MRIIHCRLRHGLETVLINADHISMIQKAPPPSRSGGYIGTDIYLSNGVTRRVEETEVEIINKIADTRDLFNLTKDQP